jgi:1,2-diacylglycerol 3-alpha-glucosyltransferase
MNRTLKIFFSCSGVGILDRGIETFFREAFDGFRGTEGLDLTLYKGSGALKPDEHVLWNLPRTGHAAQLLGATMRRNGYVVEQLSTLPSMVRAIRHHRPHVIFYSDSSLGFQLFRWRKWIGIPFKLLFSNGAPCRPPFDRTDFVHQVAPFYLEEALRAGESPEKHFQVPYGIRVPAKPPEPCAATKLALRSRLGLPGNRCVVLSAGWVRREHKRMDYVIEEVARLPHPRPFLQLLGATDPKSREIVKLGAQLLGSDGFAVASVPYDRVVDYYRAADCFVLASLKEGFGRVYLEAMMQGLPVIAHRHSVMEYVIGDEETLEDLSQPGALAAALKGVLGEIQSRAVMQRRWASVRDRFGWDVLRPKYFEMFRRCAAFGN